MSREPTEEKSIETRLKEMETSILAQGMIVRGLKPLADLAEKVSAEQGGVEAASVGNRARWWSEHQGNLMGAEMVRFYQQNAPKFGEAVARSFHTTAIAFHGVLNADAIIGAKKYNWIKPLIYLGIPAVVVLLVFSNPAVSVGFSSWVSMGINAYIILVFLAVFLLLTFLIVNRKRPEQVS